jgi:transposase
LYHGWCLRGYQEQSIGFAASAIHFRVEQNADTFRCAHCGSTRVMKAGLAPREFRTLPIGGKPVWIDLSIQRLWCASCGKTRQAKVAFADETRSYTHAFERYVLELGAHMTIQAVARHLRVGWDMVKDIQKRNLRRRFAKPKLKHLRRIAIDEISVGRGHRYLTVVLDLDSGAVVFVGSGKGADSLLGLLETAAWLGSEDRGGGHGHVAGVHRGGQRASAQGRPCVRPLPRGQTFQRKVLAVPPGVAA